MRTKHLPYHLGIAIPCFLILLNGATTFYSSIQYQSDLSQKIFWGAYSLVWITYAFAVLTPPGFSGTLKDPNALYVDCLKCGLPKPERAHHCKQCGRCVLRMDHHCPWTENCVGFRNLPHFIRFLTSAIVLNAYGVFRSAAFLIYVVEHRRYLSYFVPNKARIWVALIAILGDLFVMLTLLFLWLRVILDVANGKTQIEHWEQERAETLVRRKLAAEVEFPFDVDIFTNVRSALGEVYEWPILWSVPPGTGHSFPRLVETEQRWPPAENEEVSKHEYYRVDRWISYEGDNLDDFGVDVSTEECAHMDSRIEAEETINNKDDDNIPLSSLRKRNQK